MAPSARHRGAVALLAFGLSLGAAAVQAADHQPQAVVLPDNTPTSTLVADWSVRGHGHSHALAVPEVAGCRGGVATLADHALGADTSNPYVGFVWSCLDVNNQVILTGTCAVKWQRVQGDEVVFYHDCKSRRPVHRLVQWQSDTPR